MRLITNSVSPQQVRETDEAWIIEDVPIVKPMNLAGGYVPEWSIRETANEWDNTVPTLNHPRNSSGEPIAANKKPELHLGGVNSSQFDGEFVRSNLRVEKSEIDRLGGEAKDVETALENGEPIHVSSQYRGQKLPPGEYDGQYRKNVERIVEPDSVAILPNKQGRCSIEDGCGINPQLVANADVSLTVRANQDLEVTTVSPADIEEFTDSEWDGSDITASMPNPSEDENAAEVLDQSHVFHPTGEDARQDKSNWLFPFRETPDSPVNTRALVAIKGSRGIEGTDRISSEQKNATEEWVNDLLRKAPDDLFGSMDTEGSSEHMQENTLRKIGRSVLDSLGLGATDISENSTQTTGAESPADTTEPEGGSDRDVNREQLKEEIIANSPLTEESLSERCNDGLEAIHSDVMANAGDDPETEETTMEENEDAIVFESREDFENTVAEIVANRQAKSEKEDLASDIVANSAEYDDAESVLDDYPTVKSLKDKKALVTESGSPLPGAGMTPNAGGSDTEDFPDMEIGGEL